MPKYGFWVGGAIEADNLDDAWEKLYAMVNHDGSGVQIESFNFSSRRDEDTQTRGGSVSVELGDSH